MQPKLADKRFTASELNNPNIPILIVPFSRISDKIYRIWYKEYIPNNIY
jgi:hypothetical protein